MYIIKNYFKQTEKWYLVHAWNANIVGSLHQKKRDDGQFVGHLYGTAHEHDTSYLYCSGEAKCVYPFWKRASRTTNSLLYIHSGIVCSGMRGRYLPAFRLGTKGFLGKQFPINSNLTVSYL